MRKISKQKRKTIHHLQVNPNKINSWLVIRNGQGQKEAGKHIQSTKK
jgi:hypothetical protein